MTAADDVANAMTTTPNGDELEPAEATPDQSSTSITVEELDLAKQVRKLCVAWVVGEITRLAFAVRLRDVADLVDPPAPALPPASRGAR
jgi:hypothetical protein